VYDPGVHTEPQDTPHALASTTGEWLSEGLPDNASSGALSQFLVVKSGAGKLYGASILSTKAGSQFIQIFDSTGPPASGAVPVFVATVSGSSNLGLYWGSVGRWFSRGIVIANSSTSATQTAGSADCWFDAQYI
jgi:hypothetical protein